MSRFSPTVILSFVVVASLFFFQFLSPSKVVSNSSSVVSSYHSKEYVVEKVIDGDTLRLKGGERVRLIGIDTPESRENEKARRDSKRSQTDLSTIIQLGKQSYRKLKDMIEGKDVRLEFDVTERDKYGRLLAYVYLKADQGREIFVNAELVKLGYAMPMTIAPNVKHADLFRDLYREARKGRRGLWQDSTLAQAFDDE